MLSRLHMACLLALSIAVNGYAILEKSQRNQSSGNAISSVLESRAADPTDFGWIRRWAAIGDSFTSGIGSGSLYSQKGADWKCSRYDYSYPAILNRMFGPGVQDFQFVACSGDKTYDINNQVINIDVYDQINLVSGSLDLVLMTAGGNDLCLSSIITTCILLPFQSESGCQTILDKAQSNINTILKGNMRNILSSLKSKMNKDGIVVYTKYAEFFNTENEDCATKQEWSFPKILWLNGLKLTVERRKKFNALVIGINNAIQEVVDEISKDTSYKYKITTADWNPWLKEGVAGQMCEPGATGAYPDTKSPDLQFFKPDSSIYGWNHDELRKRSLTPEQEEMVEEQRKLWEITDKDIYNSILFSSPDPKAVARHLLDPRAPLPPNCPGDSGNGPLFGLGLPDRWGKFFHPNEIGHETIASFALEAMIEARAEQLGVVSPNCASTGDEFRCWQADGRKAYAGPDQLNKNYKDFCEGVSPPKDTTGWKWEKKYAEGTPDEHTILLQLATGALKYDKKECLDSLDRIINGCDGNDPKNPMDWKFGGRWIKGDYTYEINPSRDNRPWPVIQKPYGNCEGWYKFLYGSYKLHGAGWSTYDFGQQTLLPNIKGCLGLGVSAWKFEYYDKPDADGNEWGASFVTPIWVRARCFANNKVALASGGFTNGCKGND